jgi:hypothetical protein
MSSRSQSVQQWDGRDQVKVFGGEGDFVCDLDLEVSFNTTHHQHPVRYLSFKRTLLDRPATGRLRSGDSLRGETA